MNGNNKIYQPHDKYAKSILSRVDVAKSLIQSHLSPDLVKRIDIDSLQLTNKSFISEELQQIHSDVVYKFNIGVSLEKNYQGKNILDLAIAHDNYIVWSLLYQMKNPSASNATQHQGVMQDVKVSRAFKKDLLSSHGDMLCYASNEINKDA